MATSKSFMREPKMDTTEPSVDEVKLKRGGHAKKHMAMGGNPMAGYPMRPKARMAPSSMMGRPSGMAMGSEPPSVMRKKGGEVETKAENKAEMMKIGKVEKELKHHEAMKASKAHKGLKMGGSAKYAKDNTPNGLLGGVMDNRSVKKGSTGSIELSKYKKGGTALAAKGDRFQTKTTLKPKIDINDKVVSGAKNKSVGKKTGALELSKFKKGGVASKGMALTKHYMNAVNDGQKMPIAKGKTGTIELSKYKAGGHVAMTCKSEGGFTQMKKMAKC